VWTPPDADLAGGAFDDLTHLPDAERLGNEAPRADAQTAALMARLATLTPQQVRVLMMLSDGMLNKQIAYELTVSEATVKAHVSARIEPPLFAANGGSRLISA
jgi:DNA-binding NarL/FixJ family response regulator